MIGRTRDVLMSESKPKPQPGSCEEALAHLFEEIHWLHIRWLHFLALFGESDERIQKLNKRTGEPMGLFQRVLWDAVLLDIAKLLSWKETYRHPVVSLHRAIALLPPALAPEKRQELEAHFQSLRAKHDAILAQRDRRI